jgi:hypothetical protein
MGLDIGVFYIEVLGRYGFRHHTHHYPLWDWERVSLLYRGYTRGVSLIGGLYSAESGLQVPLALPVIGDGISFRHTKWQEET